MEQVLFWSEDEQRFIETRVSAYKRYHNTIKHLDKFLDYWLESEKNYDK